MGTERRGAGTAPVRGWIAGAAVLWAMAGSPAQAAGPDGTAAPAAAAPPSLTRDSASDTLRARADALLNAIRARIGDCGRGLRTVALATADGTAPTLTETPVGVPERPALRWSPQLAAAAGRHAGAMARTRLFDHVGTDGTTVRERVTATGYRWQSIGENLAAGHAALEDAVAGWLESRSHCEALIDPRFTEFGLARTVTDSPNDVYGTYWTLVLGRPR